jgi:hypothetical protein
MLQKKGKILERDRGAEGENDGVGYRKTSESGIGWERQSEGRRKSAKETLSG